MKKTVAAAVARKARGLSLTLHDGNDVSCHKGWRERSEAVSAETLCKQVLETQFNSTLEIPISGLMALIALGFDAIL